MVSVMSLWLPILLSTVFVFVTSSIIHMFLPWHKRDYKRVPAEDEAMDALRKLNIAPGDYCIPRAGSMDEMKSPAFKAKMDKGPRIIMTVLPMGPTSMGSNMVQWFIYCVVIGAFAACVAGGLLGPGSEYRRVFHVVALVTFAAYALALAQLSIWYKRSWITTFTSMFDGLIYAGLTAGTFGWLWPK